MKKLRLGNSDFKSIIESNAYFVDKSLLIEEVINLQSDIILFPRPRRFGKTLNLSMLRYFFDKSMPENKELFKDLKIWQSGSEIKEHCCKYPVIYMSFKDAKADTWEKSLFHIKAEISKLYKNYRYLLDSNLLYEDEKRYIEDIISEKASEVAYEISVKQLSEYLYRYHKQKVVILIDEYDAPIQSGYKNYYNQVISFMRNLLSGAFKDNSYLFKGVITGILRVSKESIFSGLNNLSVYSILNSKFADKFGFTEEEVFQAVKDFKVATDFEQIRKWYNGYKFGKTEGIYNPWSVLSYILQPEEGFLPYWTNTSSNDLIRQQISKKEAALIRGDILKLINGEVLVKDIEENFVFSDLETPKEVLWTLLLYSGYLTVKEKISRKQYELKIPNYELKTVFQDTVIDWFQTEVKVVKSLLEQTIRNLLNGNLTEFEEGFKEIIGDTFSYYDTVKKNEYIYQSYLLGLLAIIGDDYIIKSNKESGEGRYDIMLIPHDKTKNGVVIEIKQIEKQKDNESDFDFAKRINTYLQAAQNQIERNKYYKELIDNKIDKNNIVTLPIVFAGKEPYINLVKEED